MKKIILIIFIGMISAMSYGQEQKYFSVEPADHENFFYNEFWRFSEGMPAAVRFTEYFFAKDVTFITHHGYSGGIYWEYGKTGIYSYNPAEKTIQLQTLNVSETGSSQFIEIEAITDTSVSGIAIPKLIEIETITDTSIIFKKDKPADEDDAFFKIQSTMFHTQNTRIVGVTTDKCWFKGENSSNDCFDFGFFGRAEIRQELNQIYKYVCGYHLIGDLLFLEIKSVKIDNKDTELFTPSVKTFIKICVKDETVLIEKIDINTILDGTRNWTFKDMGFYIDNISIVEEPNEWDEYNRRK